MHNSLECELLCIARALASSGREQVFALMFLIFPVLLQAVPIRVINEAAIPFTGFLSKVEFDQRYPGDLFDDSAKLDNGWYVIYGHESLNYYFGPILLESIGKDYLDQLSEIVEVAVMHRPSIQDYRLQLSYEPKASSFESKITEPSTQDPLPPQASPKPSFWSFVKKLIGFR